MIGKLRAQSTKRLGGTVLLYAKSERNEIEGRP